MIYQAQLTIFSLDLLLTIQIFSILSPNVKKKIDMNDVSEKLKEVQNWCSVNKLTINLKKTNYMVIKGPRRSIAIEGVLTVSETVIGKVHVASFCRNSN